jgi:hypothetical protein
VGMWVGGRGGWVGGWLVECVLWVGGWVCVCTITLQPMCVRRYLAGMPPKRWRPNWVSYNAQRAASRLAIRTAANDAVAAQWPNWACREVLHEPGGIDIVMKTIMKQCAPTYRTSGIRTFTSTLRC